MTEGLEEDAAAAAAEEAARQKVADDKKRRDDARAAKKKDKRSSVVVTKEVSRVPAPPQTAATTAASTAPAAPTTASTAPAAVAASEVPATLMSSANPEWNMLIKLNLDLMEQLKESKSAPKRKRKTDEDMSGDEDEEATVLRETVELEDDGVQKVNMRLRHILRTPNSSPSSWWTPANFAPASSRRADPVRGSSLFLESTMGSSRISPLCIRAMHDRCAGMQLKRFSCKNADVSISDRKTMKLQKEDSESSSPAWAVERSWEKLETMAEVVEAVLNWASTVYMVRNYSFEAIAVLRVMHEFSWLAGAADSEKNQVRIVERTVDKILARNRACAQEGRPPLDYNGVRALVLNVLHQERKAEQEMYGKNIYVSRSSRETQLERQIADLKLAKNSRPQPQAATGDQQRTPQGGQPNPKGVSTRGGGRGRGRGGSARRPQASTLEEKMAETCEAYNSSSGCQTSGCARRHQCNYIEG